jgi:hypothetical protein
MTGRTSRAGQIILCSKLCSLTDSSLRPSAGDGTYRPMQPDCHREGSAFRGGSDARRIANGNLTAFRVGAVVGPCL